MALDTWVPGMLVTDRFELERLASQGGMGLIFRARDRHTGALVALKLLHASAANPQNTERLLREAQVLAEVRHPGIVGYMAHGRTSHGEVFLAMEWLAGETLAQRLRRQSLTLDETMALAHRLAEALTVVHERGIAHRDIKPSNLFLRGGQVEQVTLVDFGLARGGLAWPVTRTGELVGTLQYLAPEQVRGERQSGSEADIYALGCVLFECLTGEPPLGGEHAATLLMRILVEEPPPLRQRRPELPEALDALLRDMLCKDPGRRPTNGSALLARLEALALPAGPAAELQVAEVPLQLGREEQRLVSIILAAPRGSGTAGSGASELPNTSSLFGEESHAELVAELSERLRPYGARIDRAFGGMLIATLDTEETATDQAVRAARSACLLKQRLPHAIVVLATGRGKLSEVLPVGEVIQRVGQVLVSGQAVARAASGGEGLSVFLDELTARLLNGRFRLRKVEAGVVALEGERGGPDETRRLLGREMPCIGREQELQLLTGMFTDCVEADCAQAVLILGPAGMGKSRLRHEFVHRMRQRGEVVEVVQGRGDPILRGTPYATLGQALRRWCEIEEDMPLETRRERLGARLGRHLAGSERRAVRDFLGALCGVPFPDDDSAPLRAARQDPRLMTEQVSKALTTLLLRECAVQPVVLVLDDLQWVDTATVYLVDIALRDLEGERLFVVGLGRPEVKDLFPRLWHERRCQEVRLHGLSRKASEQLVRKALGPEVAAETVARLVERAGGHALFLEELIRAVAEGAKDELPETVLAMLQARFLRLAPGARQLLRAASLFGDTFWRGGLVALLGTSGRRAVGRGDEPTGPTAPPGPTEPTETDRWLTLLVEQEMILRQGECRFPGEVQYGFRHALVREAAYSLLTEEDRRRGHRAVGEYLERMGEKDALVLAEHYRHGQELVRAAGYYARAATHALESSDSQGALVWAARGIECGASGELLGALRGAEAWGHMWQGRLAASCESALAALNWLPAGTAPWYQAMGAVVGMAGALGRRELLGQQLHVLAAADASPGMESAFIEPAMAAVVCCCMGGLREMSGAFLRRMEEAAARLGANEARARGLLYLSEIWTRLVLDGDPWMYWSAACKGATTFGEAEDQRYLVGMEGHMAFGYALMGDRERAVALFRSSLAVLGRLGELMVKVAIQLFFVMVLVEAGEPELLDEAQALMEAALGLLPSDGFWSGTAYCAQAGLLLARRQLEPAEQATQRALVAFTASPPGLALALAWRCRVLLEQGRPAEAHRVGEEGLALLATLGGRCWMDEKLRLGAAEARHAIGDVGGARQVLAEAWREYERRAAQIELPELRERFVQGVSDNVRLRELALAWGLALEHRAG